MAINEEIIAHLRDIEALLGRIERGLDQCIVRANRIDWELRYGLATLPKPVHLDA